jgi:hypothetical protein
MRLHAMKRNMSDQQTTEQKQQSGSMELHCTPKIKIFQGSMIHATLTRPDPLIYITKYQLKMSSSVNKLGDELSYLPT